MGQSEVHHGRVQDKGHSLQAISVLLELSLQISPDPPLLICFDDYMEVIQILNDKALLLVHSEQNLLHGGIASKEYAFDCLHLYTPEQRDFWQ